MSQRNLISNKRAISEIVSYVLLIVIAVSLSVLVYTFLQLYVPKERPECPADISISVQDYACSITEKNLSLTLLNKGLFTFDAAYVRFGSEERVVKELLTNERDLNDLFFKGGDGLLPGETEVKNYPNLKIPLFSNMEVEIEPIVIIDNEKVFCEKSIISQSIKCE